MRRSQVGIKKIDLGNVRGTTGPQGTSATIRIGSVTTGPQAKVSNSGSASNAIFDFVFPTIQMLTTQTQITGLREGQVLVNQGGKVAGKNWSASEIGALPASAKAVDSERLDGKTSQQIQQLCAPTGMVVPFAGIAAPNGWLICNGMPVSRSQYANLFAVIGTKYGSGDGTSTFHVPNLQGYTVVGASSTQVGQKIGSSTHTLSIHEMPPHNHPVGEGDGYWRFGGEMVNLAKPSSEETKQWGRRVNIAQTQGNGQAHSNMQPSVYLTYLIKT